MKTSSPKRVQNFVKITEQGAENNCGNKGLAATMKALKHSAEGIF